VRRREPAIDLRSAQDAGLDGLNDSEVLAKAAFEGRVLVSHDKRTMAAALARFIGDGGDSPGVFLVIPQSASIQSVGESILLVWAASGPDDWRNRLTKIPF